MAPRVAIALAVFVLMATAAVSSGASLTLTSQVLTPLVTCTITATPATTTAVTDAYTDQALATTNFGTNTTLRVQSSSFVNSRTHIRFDLAQCNPTIPTTATVRLATLRLYMFTLPAACRTIDIFKITTAWTESAITWNTQPFGTTINNPATGSRSGSFNVGTPAGCQNLAAGYVVGGTATADVASFVSGSSTNFGWMLRDDVEGSATARLTVFSSKDLGTLAQVPQLVVTYVRVP